VFGVLVIFLSQELTGALYASPTLKYRCVTAGMGAATTRLRILVNSYRSHKVLGQR
jgi:hypothetical protein